MARYLRVKEKYCGFISVQYVAIIAACISLAIQTTFSIFFLLYGELWGLIPMAATVLSHVFFIFIISQFNSTIAITIFIGIEVVFSFVILGFSIWILYWILDPTTSFMYKFCVRHFFKPACVEKTQIFSLIWGAIFLLLFFLSVCLLPIYKTAWRNIKVKRKDSDVYIERDPHEQNAPQVQPIFNINPAPTAPPISPPTSLPMPSLQPANVFIPHQMLQQNSGQPEIVSQLGSIQLNIYSIQLPPNGNGQMHMAQISQPLISTLSDETSIHFSDCDISSARL